jgi:hypothetical protein
MAPASWAERASSSRHAYLLVFFFGAVGAACLRYWGGPFLVHLYLKTVHLCTDACMGFGAAYRVSFVLSVFFALHAVLLLSRSGLSFHSRGGCLKSLLLVGLFFLTFVVPNSVFDGFSVVARFGAAVFVLVQIVILLGFLYDWNDSWRDSDSGRVGLLVSCLIMYAASIALIAVGFQFLAHGSHCKLNQVFLGFTLALSVLLSLLSVWGETGMLLPAAGVTLYCSSLCLSALTDDESSCNTLRSSGTAETIVSLVLMAASITYSSWNVSSQSLFRVEHDGADATELGTASYQAIAADKKPQAQPAQGGAAVALRQDPSGAHDGGGDGADDEDDGAADGGASEDERVSQQRFHVIMCLASMYLAMTLTDWGVESASSSAALNLSRETMWVKIVTQWLTALLFAWTLIAPRLFPDRDFS